MARRRVLMGCALLLSLSGLLLGANGRETGPAQQPELKTLRADFVPGERTIFYDDFSDMGPGDAPPHFKARGAAPELRAGGAVRQLTFVQTGTLVPNLTALPANFTFEAETKFEVPRGNARLYLVLFSEDREAVAWSVLFRPDMAETLLSRKIPKPEELARAPFKADLSQPMKLALWIQNGRLRAFVNDDKRIDVNLVELPPIDRVELQSNIAGAGVSVGYRAVRFAESAPDFSQVINASGRYVSHGILFDTDSDRLKSESAAIIQAVARGLAANPALKLLIEGHTDSVGNAAHNLDLSKRRA